MRKKLFFIFVFIIFIQINVLAEMTDTQEKEVAEFARNLIIKGLSKEHLDNKGMPILAYKQGPPRAYGYHDKLSFIDYDYHEKISINSNKWVFDCASFTSYVYKKTLNIDLIDSNYLGGNPYMVSNYENDRVHFKAVGLSDNNHEGMTGQDLLKIKNTLRPGDLIIDVSYHIAIYLGNDEVAEATPSYIGLYSNDNTLYKGEGLYNLGMGITNLDFFINQKMIKDHRFMVLRIRDGVVPSSVIPNTTIIWPDTGKIEDLGSVKETPKTVIDVKLSTTEYTKKVVLDINISNNSGIKEISIGNQNNPKYQSINNVNNYHTEYEVTINGTYYLSVRDSLNNEEKKVIEINNIDNNIPTIEKIEYRDNAIIVTAKDNETSKEELEYSFNNQEYQKDAIYYVNGNGTYNIKVRDKAGNVKEDNYIINNNEVIKENSFDYLKYILITLVIMLVIVSSVFFIRKRHLKNQFSDDMY